jgi:hypothetical protein
LSSDLLGSAPELLARTSGAIDAAFVRAGGRLGESTVLVASMRETLAALPASLSSSAVREALADLAAICQRLREVSRAVASERDLMGAIASSLSATSSPLARLNRSVKMVDIVAINARVTTASTDTGAIDLSVFNSELASLAQQTRAKVNAFNQTMLMLGKLATKMVEQAGGATAYQSLEVLADRIEHRLAAFQSEVADVSTWAAMLQQPLTAAQGFVGSGVMSLQSGDSVKQRLEHAAIIVRTCHTGARIDDAADRLWLRDRGRSLVGALVLDGASDLDTSLDGIDMAMRAIEAGCDTVASASRRDVEASTLNVLADEVERALLALADYWSRQERIDSSAGIVVRAIIELRETAEAIGRIESEMRLVGLNATIKCAHLGERGRALNVIAQQLNALTTETVQATREVVEAFHQTEALTGAYSANRAGSAVDDVADIRNAGQSAVAVLNQADSRIENALMGLNQILAAVRSSATRSRLAFTGLRASLEDLLDLAHKLSEAPDAQPDFEVPENCRETVAGWRATYTMASERLIHDTAFPEPRMETPELAVEMF